jgi:hypothetical protein
MRRKVLAAMMVATIAIAVHARAAEEEGGDKRGAEDWSSTNNHYCVRAADRCTRWSDDNVATTEVHYQCGGLWLFHSQLKVGANCDL